MTDFAAHIRTFLCEHLPRDRGASRHTIDSYATSFQRLAALKSFFRYLEQRVPACLEQAGQVHAIPAKRGNEPLVDYLSRDEVRALLNAPDARTASGVRDRAMVHLAYAAGLRVSELIGLGIADLRQPDLGTVRVTGKGRRERDLPQPLRHN